MKKKPLSLTRLSTVFKPQIKKSREKYCIPIRKISSFTWQTKFFQKNKIDYEDLKIKSWKFLNFVEVSNIPLNFLDIVIWDPSTSQSKILRKKMNFIEYGGVIGRSHTLGIKLDFRWLKLNPIEGNLIEYRTQSNCPNKPYRIINLNTISDIQCSNQNWLMKKSMSYWEINNKFIMWNKTVEGRK